MHDDQSTDDERKISQAKPTNHWAKIAGMIVGCALVLFGLWQYLIEGWGNMPDWLFTFLLIFLSTGIGYLTTIFIDVVIRIHKYNKNK